MTLRYSDNAFWDLSHPISAKTPCTPQTIDLAPKISFQEVNSLGPFAMGTRMDNLVASSLTHVVFPGQLPGCAATMPTVGEYPLERFIGVVMVIDVAPKLDAIRPFFDSTGRIAIEHTDQQRWLELLQTIEQLAVTVADVESALQSSGIEMCELKGLLFFSGLSRYWATQHFETWEYIYFFNPFPTPELCEQIVAAGLSFVGIDAFQIGHPLAGFQGDELPFVLNQACRQFVIERRGDLLAAGAQRRLLENDVLLYQNLNIPAAIRAGQIAFQGAPWNVRIAGVTTDALARPIASRAIVR